ncbi:MAG: synthase subunit delta [Caulobacteraceae bacterium]|nr:synthase subunit delta [Caulobacteraceae bacterium]
MADDTKATDAGQRYAKALFELADETGALAAVERDLVSLVGMIKASDDLRRVLASPAFSAEDKAKGLAGVAIKAKFHQTTQNFLGLLSANGRAGEITGVIAAFQALAAKARGAVSAQVTSAAPLSAAQSKAIASALRSALGKDPEIETRVDPAILGGLKVRVGSRLFDASLKSRLDSLKFALKRA